MAIAEIGGPAAWTPAEVAHTDAWKVELDRVHVAELLHALGTVDRPGIEVLHVAKEDFTLPTLAPVLAGMVDELMDGRGFVLLRGVPVESLTERQVELLGWMIGLHVGIPIQQGANAAPLVHVRDQGIDKSSPLARGYQHRAHLDYHTDSPDVVALLCVRPAWRGGVSTIVSAVSVHNEIVRTRPDLAEVLYRPWWHDRRRGDGPDSFFQCPIYAVNDEGKLFAYYGPDYVRSAPRGEGIPELADEQVEAMELLEETNNDPRFVLNMDFKPGDMQFLNNYVIMHGRTEYEDFAEPERKRDLIRLWLTVDRDLHLPASISDRGLMARTVAFER
jgi:Taurine catabolism dioxygenase TauD, TfdA family